MQFNLKIFITFLALLQFLTSAQSVSADTCKDYFNDQRFKASIPCYAKKLRANPNDVQSRFWYAAALYYDRQYNASYQQYSYIAKKYPNTQIGKYSKAEAQKVQQKMSSVTTARQNDRGNYVSELDNCTYWAEQKIRVFIQQSPYKPYAQKALNEWQQKTGGTVAFQYVPVEQRGQIKIYFVDKILNAPSSYLGLTNLKYAGDKNKSATIQILQRTDSNKMRSYAQVYPVVLHEVGHALGLSGHSKNNNDIMYENNNTNDVHLSNRDINTIKAIYAKRKKPGVFGF